MEGRVTSYWPKKNFGFIIGTEDPTEYFFHQADVIDNGIPLKRWSHVTFELGRYKGQTKAIKVRALPPDQDEPLRPRDYSARRPLVDLSKISKKGGGA
jgi:cold shock CspA family protein